MSTRPDAVVTLDPWFSEPLRGRAIDPRVLAAEIAAGVGLVLHEELEEIVRLYLEALDTSLALDAPQLLVEQLVWQEDRLSHLAPRVDRRDFVVSTAATLARRLEGEHWETVNRLVGETVQLLRQHRVREVQRSDHPAPAPMSPLTREYLRLALSGERRQAFDLVVGELDFGIPPDELLVEVVQPAMVEVGRLWQQGLIDVHQQRHCSVVSDQVLSLLFPSRLDVAPQGRRAVTACITRDHHDLGMRIVDDLLVRDGWSTTYLGADTPVRDIVEVVAQERADLLAVSASMPNQVGHVRRLIGALRSDERCAGVPVVVGGRPFLLAPRLVELVGADATAPDARRAVEVCNALVAQPA